MRKTLKRNLSYDDRNHLYDVSLYYDGEDGRRVRRTRTYPTMEQAEQVMQNIGAILEEAGLTFANVVKTTCFLADLADFAAFNAVYAKYFPEAAPARSCFAVAGLPKGAKLEVETICIK